MPTIEMNDEGYDMMLQFLFNHLGDIFWKEEDYGLLICLWNTCGQEAVTKHSKKAKSK